MHVRLSPAATPQDRNRRNALIDLAILVVGAIVVVAMSIKLQLTGRVTQWLQETANFQSDLSFILAFYLMVAAFLFAVRRWREALDTIEIVERSARTDALTGLPNRCLFIERLQAAMAQKTLTPAFDYAVLFLDFDRFKIINDSLGHDIGDAMLREIASRLCNLLDFDRRKHPSPVDGHCVARMGGDEFVVLLNHLKQHEDSHAIAEKLLIEFRRPLKLGDHSVFTTASIGIVAGRSDYERPEEVVRDADSAMYEAKRTGKNRFVQFDESMHRRVVRRLRLENELRKMANEYQLCVAYQPIVSLDTGELISVEALLRWTHPELGVIGPTEFISIAEESDLIHTLGEWVLREGCRQMADWIARLGDLAPATISINLSRKQFMQKDLPDRIARVLMEEGVDPCRVQLEITEDAFASDAKAAIEAMQAIKDLGVKLAIDDFGTGFSSLSSLRQFPVDVLKLDKSICLGIHDSTDAAALVHALAILVANVGIKMIAEGIESAKQVTALQELGCQYGQGYYFSYPMTPEDVEVYVRNKSGNASQVTGAAVFANRWENRLNIFTPTTPQPELIGKSK